LLLNVLKTHWEQLSASLHRLLMILPSESKMMWTPHITVATIVQQNISEQHLGTRFLLVEEMSITLPHLVINQPAGHVEANETLVEAAIRETLEETGYTVSIESVLGIYTYTPPNDAECTYYRICFLANIESFDATRTLDTGIVRTVWLTLDELKATNRSRSPLVIRCIEDALAGQRFPLSLIFEQPRSKTSTDKA
jgi:ADP-ribose pyrophosphatase YjhB (NUDIX family)